MADTKKVSMTKPVELRVGGGAEVYFLTVYENGAMEIRPKGARDPEATVKVTVDGTYQRALLLRAKADKPTRTRRTDRRGLLALEREANRKL
jgi:hypothetical protein